MDKHDKQYADVGMIIRPHGLKGAVKVKYELSQLPVVGDTVQIGGQPMQLLQCQRMDGMYLIFYLEGITTIEQADELRGLPVAVSVQHLSQKEYLINDLIGLEAIGVDTKIGKVISVENLPAQPVLKIKMHTDEIFLIPFVSPEYIGEVNVSAGTIELKNWELFI